MTTEQRIAVSTPKRPAARGDRLRIVYLVRGEGLASVFMSQVVRPMSALADVGHDVRIVVIAPCGEFVRAGLREAWRRVLRRLPPNLVGRVHRVMAPPSRITWPGGERRALKFWLRRHADRRQPLFIQGRNATATGIALDLKPSWPELRVIFDSRGIEDEEYLYQASGTEDPKQPDMVQRAQELTALQGRAARDADAVLCVSRAMVDYLCEKHRVKETKFAVVPCTVDVDQFDPTSNAADSLRSELGLDGRFVVVYCGSLSKWQLPAQSLELFRRIIRLEPSAHFLAVVTQPERMRRQIDECGICSEHTTVVSVPHREVPRYLAAADCGLLLREASPVNAVASPIKFGEYLASGTPVILHEGIGDYSELARNERVGVVLSHGATEDELDGELATFLNDYRLAPSAWRGRCRSVASEYLDSAVHLPTVAALYDQLATAQHQSA